MAATDELYKKLKKAIGKKPIKMQALAVKVKLAAVGDPVASAVAARIRVQLTRLVTAKLVIREGTRATTTYRKA